jgi:hypothetical protein
VKLSAERLRAAAQAVRPKVLVGRIRSGADDFGDTVIMPRRRTWLLSLLGGLGLLLTLVGISSVTAYAVAHRKSAFAGRSARRPPT